LGKLQVQSDADGNVAIVSGTQPPAQAAGRTIQVNYDYNWVDFSKVIATNITTGQSQLFNYLAAVNFNLGTNMSSSDFSSLLLLHEFRHTPSGGNAPQETQDQFKDFNTAIYNNCIRP
jgi:hypothetical protein